MSRPRAPTSVVTRTGAAPARNRWRDSSRSHCARSPWRAAHARPNLRSEAASALIVLIWLTNTITRAGLRPRGSDSKNARSDSRRRPSSQMRKLCVTVAGSAATAFTGAAAAADSSSPPAASTYTRRGARSQPAAACSRASGNVAEKRIVWRSGRSWPQTCDTCGAKPSETMASASSKTTSETRPTATCLVNNMSSSRPVVATTSPTAASTALTCSSRGAPP